MNYRIIRILAICSLFVPNPLDAQDKAISPSIVITGEYLGESPALRDLPTITDAEWKQMTVKAKQKLLNPKLRTRTYPFANTALPKGDDPVWQKNAGAERDTRAPILNFDGFDCPGWPPDPNGTMGQEYYMQTINFVYSIYDRSGALICGPGNLNYYFLQGSPALKLIAEILFCLFDEQADRWLVVEFALPAGSTDLMLIAVSTTGDPTGSWHRYSFRCG